MASCKKKAKRQGRVIVFVDESGLSEQPHRVRTWSRKGHTPQLTISFNWGKLSMIAGISWYRCYFKLFKGTIGSDRVIMFLKALKKQIKRKLLIIWDGLAAHRSSKVKRFIDSTDNRIELHRLPAYAPELNPVEYVWANLKNHHLANFCPKQFDQLTVFARKKMNGFRRNTKIIRACWKHAQLTLSL